MIHPVSDYVISYRMSCAITSHRNATKLSLLRRYCQRLSKTDFYGGAQSAQHPSCTLCMHLLAVALVAFR